MADQFIIKKAKITQHLIFYSLLVLWFTCCVTKVINLEIIVDLSGKSLFLPLRKVLAKRAQSKLVISNNLKRKRNS